MSLGSFRAISASLPRLLLPVLALVAVFVAPLALAMHEAEESHAAAVAHVDDDHAHSDGSTHHKGVPHHDDSHCAFCATVHNGQHLLTTAALILDLTDEAAPRFVIPPYLAPSTGAPTLTLAVPRGPPVRA